MDLLTQTEANFESSYSGYSDAAIVVFGRPSTEAADFFPGEAGMTNEGARNILGLTTNERAILQEATDNFNKVIVIINSVNPMEIEEIKTNSKVQAILWIGAPGNYGFYGVANIIKGEANPSGRLVDIYATDSTSSPAMQNFGIIPFSNPLEIEPAGTTNYRGNWYLVEAEGIYTGYRYYETRYTDTVLGRFNASSTAGTFDSTGNWKYQQEVSYPFGYGLSYTTFTQSLDSVRVANNKKIATVVVTVTNTGSKAGKDVVQVYAQAPYITGGVEKSSVQLLDFAKTEILEPNESQTITLMIDMQYLASYDHEEEETYILDAGDYYITIGNGSHEAANNILAHQGYTTANGMDANGSSNKVYKWTWNEFDNHTFAISKAGVAVTNQLENADLNYWLPDTVTYLSRSNWNATWPQLYSGVTANADLIHQLRNDTYEIKQNDDTSDILWGQQSDLTLADMKGATFEDYRWEEILNKMTLAEAMVSIAFAQNIILGMPSIGLFDVMVNDGPMGFHGTLTNRSVEGSPWYVSPEDEYATFEARTMPVAVVIAATFNKELAYENGVLFGNDSLFGGNTYMWAPGLNLHRTPYNGRNHEYYSEDPVLAGQLALEVCLGALTKGMVMSPKHFAFNDQESNRAAVAPFMHEQKARELELRGYQIAFEGGALGTMTSFSRIGATFVNAHVGLMQNILRDEWDFNGYIVTDMINGPYYMTLKESIMASVTNFDTSNRNLVLEGGAWSYFTEDNIKNDREFLLKMKEGMHYVLYTIVNSNAMNGINSSSKSVWQMTSWRAAYISAISVSGLLTLGFGSLYVLKTIKSKKTEV